MKYLVSGEANNVVRMGSKWVIQGVCVVEGLD